MVYNKDILFIHIGKTGGTSAAKYLCSTIHPPVYNVIPDGAMSIQYGHETNLSGQRHATLVEALKFTKKQSGFMLKDFKKVIAVIRHPYNLEISLFNYYKRLLQNDPTILDGAPKRKAIVLKDDFAAFVKGKFYHRNGIHIKKYVAIDGKLPKNVEVIKFEEMTPKFLSLGKTFGNSNPDFPHLNKTKAAAIEDYITPELEPIIFRKYRWVFQYGDYRRINFKTK
jgi:hypothetical protein